MVILNQARGLGTLAYLAAQTALKTQAWQAVAGQISVPAGIQLGTPVTFTLQAPGIDLSNARITWEVQGQEPGFSQSLTFTPPINGNQWLQAEAHLPDGRRIFAVTNFNVTAANLPNLVWVDDALPAGAVSGADGGDSWNWITSNPSANSGLAANQSAVASGSHQHFFYNATATLQIGTGDILYSYVYLDPLNPPSQLMLQWNDGTWEHRAYWGANTLNYGVNGTASRMFMGSLPPAGQWVQLRVPASQVNLEGHTLNGMAFTLFGGRATWDTAGRLTQVNNAPRAAISLSGAGALVTWNSTSGSVYHVSYKNSLGDSSWVTASPAITATSNTSSWLDTGTSGVKQRFYRVGP
jgi:hypothetical protein